MKNLTLLPLTALFLIAGLCLTGCEESSPAKKKDYTVSFDLNGATGSIAPQTIAEGAKVAQPDAPTRDGYTFEGWYTDEATTQEYNFTTATVTATITLYAKWVADAVETFTVSFDSNGGSAVESLTVAEGGKVAQPTGPSKDDYFFGGWYTDEATTLPYDFTTATVTATITLYAKWIAATNRVLIPDVSFRTHLKERIGDAFEGEYMDTTHANVLGLTALDVASKNISSLAGIEYFTALIDLRCNNNQLTELDITKHTALTSLNCTNNRLTTLDVTQNTALTQLLCSNNSLTALDVTQNTALTELRCNDNLLTALNVRQNTVLTALDCSNNSLTALNVRQNTELAYLRCVINSLTELDVTQNTALAVLWCSNNSLTALDVRQNTALTYLRCGANSLTELDVTQNTALTYLKCVINSLTALDVTQNTGLAFLDCSDNELAALDVRQNTVLTAVNCGNNSLSSLDVRQNTVLTLLFCNSNSLTELDVNQNTALIRLWCQGNQLSSLDLRGRKSFAFLRINAGSTNDASTATNPLMQLYVHTALQTHDEIREVKTNRSADVTISTYNDANTLVCTDFNPNEGDAGTCKD